MRLSASAMALFLIATAGAVWWSRAEPRAAAEPAVAEPLVVPAPQPIAGMQPAPAREAPPEAAPRAPARRPAPPAAPPPVVEIAEREAFIPDPGVDPPEAAATARAESETLPAQDADRSAAQDADRSADWVERLLALYEVVRE